MALLGTIASRFRLEPQNPLWSLFSVSFATLCVEVLLIRWTGTEVRIFAYFQNLTLIACFLGFGLGCLRAPQRKSLLFNYVALCFLILLVEAPFPHWKAVLESISFALSISPDAAMWALAQGGETAPLISFVMAAVTVTGFLLFIIATMVPLGQWVGSFLDEASNPVRAYSVNLVGSLAGIWVFAFAAFLELSPVYWFGCLFVLLILVRPPNRHLGIGGSLLVLGCLLLLAYDGGEPSKTYWSPYQKLQVYDRGERNYQIDVNNTGYMSIANLTPEFLARHPELAEQYRQQSSYDTPYRFASSVERVLIVGGGAGNDVAGALRNGAQAVDVVEIDPVILRLGKRLHPERPYDSSVVRTYVNDARAFLRRASEPYDVIVFGLLDSHTQFSDLSNMRIDNYVYTEDAFREARRLLKPSGILVLKFEVRAPWTWMGERFYAMLEHMFGRAPVVYYLPPAGALSPASIFITSVDSRLWERAAKPELKRLREARALPFALPVESPPPPTTDDWPYVYHRDRAIPRTYLTVSLILLALALWLVRGSLAYRQASTCSFFFLGAGFLLLETQLVSRLGLYFGTTWLVNCIALSAILSVLVLANLYLAHVQPRRMWAYYVLLVVSLVANYLFPWAELPYATQTVGLLLSLGYALPLFCAGVIFAEMFQRSKNRSGAFGANIFGAVAGGLAQNVSFILGMKALLLVAAGLYVLAATFSESHKRRVVPAAINSRLN